MLEWDSNVAASEWPIRAPDNQVYRYRLDSKTLVQRGTVSGGMGVTVRNLCVTAVVVSTHREHFG